jgi:zinc transport system substrate-binding protein
MELRQSALFEAHDHDHAKEDHDSDVHEGHDHDAHDHDEHSDKETADAHGHGHYDSHVWLSPENAALWLGIIADQLSAVDPENAETYKSNASAGRAELDTVVSEVRSVLDPLKDRRFIVFHDAYQYFESSFGLQASGAISLSDASDPSAARIAEIQARIAQEGIDCVLAEPQFNPGLVETVLNGTNAKTGILDPLGSALEPGPDFYPNLIRTLAASLAECL